MKNTRTLYIAAAIILASTPLRAAQPPADESETTRLTQMVVTAPAPESDEVVDAAKLAVPSVSDSVLEALDNHAGIQLRRGTLAGAENGKLRMRGLNETRLNILADGVSLHRDGSYGLGPVDWSAVTREDTERVELILGSAPARYGNTLGGVVNIVPAGPTEELSTKLQATGGSLGTREAALTHSGSAGTAGWFVNVGRFETDGYLRNNFLDRTSINTRLAFALPADCTLGLGLNLTDGTTGMAVYNLPDSPWYDSDLPDAKERAIGGPGIGGRLVGGVTGWGDDTKVEDESLAVNAWFAQEFERGSYRLDARVWNSRRHEYYYAGGSHQRIYERETRAEDDNWSLQGVTAWDLADHRLEAGGETRHYGWGEQKVRFIDESAFTGAINSPYFAFLKNGFEGQPHQLRYNALFIQDIWGLAEICDLELGLRQEWFRADPVNPEAFGFPATVERGELEDNHLDPRLALTVHPWTGGELTARVGRAHRYPTSPEFFWWYLNRGSQFFNTDLAPEAASQYELSLEQDFADRAGLVLRAYAYDISDYISGTFVPGTGRVVYNIEEVELTGVELGVQADLGAGVTLWTNFTWQQGEKDGDPWDANNELSGELPDLPSRMANLGIDYRRGDELTVSASLRHVDEREHLANKQLVTLDKYTLADCSLAWRFLERGGSSWELLAAAENLLDEDYEEEEGYPLPGATFSGGIRVSF